MGAPTFAALSIPMTRRVRQIELTLGTMALASGPGYAAHYRQHPAVPAVCFRYDGRPALLTSSRCPSLSGSPIGVCRLRYLSALSSTSFSILFGRSRIQSRYTRCYPSGATTRTYLTRNHFEIVHGVAAIADQDRTPATLAGLADGTLRLRQRPGDDNALGPIKFVFPNCARCLPARHARPKPLWTIAPRLQPWVHSSRRPGGTGCIRNCATLPANGLLRKLRPPCSSPRSIRVDLVQPIKVMIPVRDCTGDRGRPGGVLR